jgi:CDP-6-deoxy-D-xylo-4-hexulose-3-dehydrase
VRVPYAGKVIGLREFDLACDAVMEGNLTAGRYADRFEGGLASYVGTTHAFMVNSGSSANLLALAALQLPRGCEVITVACGFPTTIAPIVQQGCVPVFVDVDDTLNIDVTQLEAALSDKTRAIMVAHTLGVPFYIAAVLDFCEAHDLYLIEDNCDSLGSEYAGARTGTFGSISTCSFYPAHHITTGEGGAVLTSDGTLAKRILSLRDWGRDCSCAPGEDDKCGARHARQDGTLPHGYDHKYVYSRLGYNLKATDIQAAIGCAQLERLDGFTAARRANWQRLADALGTHQQQRGKPSPFAFVVRHPERDRIVAACEAAGVQTRPLFAGNITRHPCMDGVDYRALDLTNTDAMMRDTFMVGCWPGLTTKQLDHIVDTLGGVL